MYTGLESYSTVWYGRLAFSNKLSIFLIRYLIWVVLSRLRLQSHPTTFISEQNSRIRGSFNVDLNAQYLRTQRNNSYLDLAIFHSLPGQTIGTRLYFQVNVLEIGKVHFYVIFPRCLDQIRKWRLTVAIGCGGFCYVFPLLFGFLN